MLTGPPSHVLDLLVVGGMTIDRFADGSSAVGGSALHIARATARRGVRLGVVTAVGPEPIAQAGLSELRRLAIVVDVTVGTATATFGHSDTAAIRHLHMDRQGGKLHVDAGAVGHGARALLFAPIGDEIEVEALSLGDAKQQRGAILQGWLRTMEPDSQVRALPLVTLDPALMHALGRLDLLVASQEDMLAEGDDPMAQLHALREAVGSGPSLALTDGADGLWLNTGASQQHVAAPWRVDGVSTVGAGDVLAAFMLIALADKHPLTEAAELAMRVVAEELEERKRG